MSFSDGRSVVLGKRGTDISKMKCFILIIATGCFVRGLPAGGETTAPDGPISGGPSASTNSLYHKGQWDFSLESAYLFKVVYNPLTAIGGDFTKNKLQYRLATQALAARYQLTDPAGPFFLRGVLEVSGSFIYSAIIQGPEPYFVGLALGLRYNFVQPETNIVPYLEIRGGPGLTDARARGKEWAQQQDFTFTYIFGAGLRYDFSSRVSFSLGVANQHISNLYLTRQNYGFDVVGFQLGLNLRF